MNLFEQLVDQAMRSQPPLAPLRMVVEKELLHHDILREMSRAEQSGTLPIFIMRNRGVSLFFPIFSIFSGRPNCARPHEKSWQKLWA
jgi:hypothetical protein